MKDRAALTEVLDRELAALIRPYLPRVAAAVLVSLLLSALNGAIAWFFKPFTNAVVGAHDYALVAWVPPIVAAAFTARGFLAYLYAYLMRSAGIKLVRDTRVRLYRHLVRLPVTALGTETSARVISRLLSDTGILRLLVSDTILTVFKEVPSILTLLAVAFYRRWDVTLLALVVAPAIGAGTHRFGKGVKLKRKQAQQTIAQLTHRIAEATAGAKVIKVFGRGREMEERFAADSQVHYRQELKIVRLKEMTKVLVDVCTGFGLAFVIWYGQYLVSAGTITVGDYASALVAILMLFGPVKKVGGSYAVLQEIRGAKERMNWLEGLAEETDGDVPLPAFRSEIRFEGVTHRYRPDAEPVLRGIDLVIHKGEVLAVVGPSGAGKTTLIDLIPRFMDPTEGRVLVDGIDLRRVRLADLRALIGLVGQDVILFNDTVRENIAFGRPDATDEEIREAARRAYAHEFIQELPRGYETLLGERGLNLSGGQRQRIAIARAILKSPPILILDEATSALDSVSETLVQRALDELMQGRTTIVVAHRLSTIRNADRIVVLDHGRIRAEGRHEDLVAGSGVYRELYATFEAGRGGAAGEETGD
ncbi:ABC transporter ATP-binding protein [Dissulfurirhabdus thermomarina]|uniref:ABC transporter ATP-binding protein n=1 Tax=Dissulfurirhabdus thermomarina TaxID=1765737 RepID=A0A6N9TXN6_DISTH|nr:ABC transporter ATP-binding protein [Dissulfurirhabdus thermomarina]NDY43236.1 ABC transporter ATP-binding protein [Dissulfurirhabdus thermomarina]NMX23026.1 ABC transporter ATP-binding protein [Dissulfurirhabdus thermomarina]